MFPVVHSGEVQKLLHITADVFSLFPNHSNLYVYGGAKWNPSDTEGDKFINHARVEEAAVFTGFYKLKCGMNLAATHDYVRRVLISWFCTESALKKIKDSFDISLIVTTSLSASG